MNSPPPLMGKNLHAVRFHFYYFFFTWILFLGGFPLLGRVDEEVVFPFDVGIEFFFFFWSFERKFKTIFMEVQVMKCKHWCD